MSISPRTSCSECHQPITWNETFLSIRGGSVFDLCSRCADINKDGTPKDTGEGILMDFMNNPPWEVIADWCEENNRQPDAEWVRKYRMGNKEK